MSAINLNEAIMKIKAAGATRVRAVPMANQSVHSGSYQIEVAQGDGSWTAIVEGITKSVADELITQATNRVILG